jgi:hypothetical protein
MSHRVSSQPVFLTTCRLPARRESDQQASHTDTAARIKRPHEHRQFLSENSVWRRPSVPAAGQLSPFFAIIASSPIPSFLPSFLPHESLPFPDPHRHQMGHLFLLLVALLLLTSTRAAAAVHARASVIEVSRQWQQPDGYGV